MLPHSPVPSLETIFEAIHGFQRSCAIKAALDLDFFTGIADGANTTQKLAERCHASERGTRILCDYLSVFGLLTKDGNRYELTADTAFFLNRSSPAFMGTAIDFLLSGPQTEPFADLASTVRAGGAPVGNAVIAPDHPVWVKFARAMAPLMAFPAELVADLLGRSGRVETKVLDIAAGHGLYGIAMGKRNGQAEIVAVDWPNVLAVASENARQAGIEHRFRTLPGSAFNVELGEGYDVALVVNFLHHFEPDIIEPFLRKVRAALSPGGRLAIVEFIPNEDRVAPRVPAQFAMMMLATTPAGDAYTFSDYQRMLSNAGFASSELHDLQPTYFRVVLASI